MGETYFTPKQVARAIGVSESSLKRWCDQGKLGTQRTAGGHRRVSLAEVMQFLRETGQGLVCPEVLGLPSACGQGKNVLDKARERFLEAILAGDDERCRRIVIDLFLAKRCISEICDELLAPAMRRCGQSWECGHTEIYQERRACRIIEQILYELRACLTVRTDAGFRAIGGTPSGDPYRLPTMMVELTLRELGRHAENLGSDIPFASLKVAAEQLRPKLFWLSVSAISSVPEFLEGYRDFYRTARKHGTAVVVGGVGLIEPIRRQMEFTTFCDSLGHLREFVSTLYPLPPLAVPLSIDELPPPPRVPSLDDLSLPLPPHVPSLDELPVPPRLPALDELPPCPTGPDLKREAVSTGGSAARLAAGSTVGTSADSSARFMAGSSVSASADSSVRMPADSSVGASADSSLRMPNDSSIRVPTDSSTDSAIRVPTDSSMDSSLRMPTESSADSAIEFPPDSESR